MTVFCSGTELEEYGEVLRVGDRVDRLAGRRRGSDFGGALDEVEWALDRYAEVVGGGRVTVRGRIAGIEAVFVRLTLQRGRRWVPRPGSGRTEAVTSTAETRRIRPDIARGAVSAPGGRGDAHRSGHPVAREGDEHCSGWLLHLDHEELAGVVGGTIDGASDGPDDGSGLHPE